MKALALRERLRRAAAATFAMRIAAVVLGFLASVALARLLGVESFGIYALVSAWTLLLTTPAMLGFERLLVRDLAAYEATDDWPRIRGLLRLAQRIVIGLGIVFGVALAVAGLALGDPNGLGAPLAFVLGGATVPLLVLINLRQSALQGLRRVTLSFVPEALVRPGVLLVLTIIALLLGVGPASASVGVAFQLVASIAAVGLGWITLRRYLGARRAGPSVHPSGWIAPTIPFAYLATVAIIAAQIDLVLVGLFTTPEQAGAYAVAVRGATLASLPLTVINATTAPLMSRLWTRGDRAGLQRETTSAARSALVVTLLVTAGLVLFARPFLDVFGRGFGQGVEPLIVLALGRVIGTATGPTGTLLAMTGQERAAAGGVTLGVIVEVVMCVLLIPTWGLVGAAIASSAAMAATNVVQAVVVRRRLGIRTTALGV